MENSNENQKSSAHNNQNYNPDKTSEENSGESLSGIRGGGTDINALKSTGSSKEINSAGDVGSLNDEMKDRYFESKEAENNPAKSHREENSDEENVDKTTQSNDDSFDPSDWPIGHVNEEGGFGDERFSEEAGNGTSVGNP